MADPKYANLFGIAYDQPDVYETSDLPESEQNADIYEEDTDTSAGIEKLHVPASEAFSKFKDKALIASRVDFSDRLSKTRRTGYDARSGEWELAGKGEQETVMQKYQRLQCEMKELLEEISSLKDLAKDEAINENVPYANFSVQLEGMLKQLSNLNLQEELGSSIYNSNQTHGDQLRKLLLQLDLLCTNGAKVDNKIMQEKSDEIKDAIIKYQLSVSPGQVALARSTRTAELEQRLNRIETCLGASSSKLSRLGNGDRSLMETAQYLSAKSALLDPTVLDAAELRVGSLVTKLDQVLEKSAAISGSQDADKVQKIDKLYELAKEMDQISKVLPQTLDRMNALQSLHQQSSEFAKILTEMETLQERLTAATESNRDLLNKVEEGLQTNFPAIKTNIESLNNRLQVLQEKMNQTHK